MFAFDLLDIAEIDPVGAPEAPSLSWFALTDGYFRMPMGAVTLFEYTDAILRHWNETIPYPNYQVAAFAETILDAAGVALQPLSPNLEGIARDTVLFDELLRSGGSQPSDDDIAYCAWRWLGERSPWTSYLVASPRIFFIRIDDMISIRWDSSELRIEGLPVWTAVRGSHLLPVPDFVRECRSFAARLLEAMEQRLRSIETGASKPRCHVDLVAARQEQLRWTDGFARSLEPRAPDVSWEETEASLRCWARRAGVELPFGP